MKLRLVHQLCAFVIAIVVLTTTALGAVFYLHARAEVERELDEVGRVLADQLAVTAAPAVAVDDAFHTLPALVEGAARQHDVVGVEVTNGQGRVLTRVLNPEAEGSETVEFVAKVATVARPSLDADGAASGRGTVRVLLSPASMQQAMEHVLTRFAFIAAFVILIGSVLALGFSRWMASRVDVLVQAFRRIGAGDYAVTVPAAARDEIGELCKGFNAMVGELDSARAHLEERVAERTAELHASNEQLHETLDTLDRTQRKLIEASRKTGMADVATAVLHNVGNVLTSVNVTSGIVDDIIRKSKAQGIGKVVALLRENQAQLARFLTEDPRGVKIPEYLAALATAMDGERRKVLDEMASLQKNIDHIKVIITTQQSHAKSVSGVIQQVSLAALIDEALALNTASYGRHGIEIARDFAALPDATIDQHKVLQIVLNLLSNARHAVDAGPNTPKQVTVRLSAVGADRCAIVIEDNGCGIPAENLNKIFNHGFTTKKQGHGFGLHSSANAATELGGSLAAASDGPGHGARFTLELPLVARRDAVKLAS